MVVAWNGRATTPGASRRHGHGAGHREAVDAKLGTRYLYCEGVVPVLFTENETNTQRIFGVANRTPYVKDRINDRIIHGQTGAVNPDHKGTKAAPHYRLTIQPGESQVVRLRLSDVAPADLAKGNSRGPSSLAESVDFGETSRTEQKVSAVSFKSGRMQVPSANNSTRCCKPAAARPTNSMRPSFRPHSPPTLPM